jgi:malonyl-CoA/methylmalonyl-CoA synthetase
MANDLFAFFRAAMPDDRGKLFIEDPTGRADLSYSDLLVRTGRIANLLVSLGVKPGDRVAVHADKSVESLLVYLATIRAGAVYLPLNPAYVPAEVRYFLGDAEPALFICRPEDEAAMAPLIAELDIPNLRTLGTSGEGSLLADLDAQPTAFEDVDRGPDDLAAILYTSGTTGRSKGAMLTHFNLRSNAATLVEYWRFTADDRLIHALPIFHTHGLFVATNVILASGATMLFLPRFDVRDIIALLPSATALMGVPTFYSRLLAEPDLDKALVRSMRLFVSGSAPLSAETHREFERRTGHAILERYGMTETNMNTSNPYDGDRVAGSVGFALPGVEIRIADPATGEPLAEGPGSIEVRGPNVFKGYWRMPEKTAQDFRADGFFITGDLGYRDARGYVHIAGRAKDLVIAGGFNIYPAEIENEIDAIPGVAESAVIGVPHVDLGEAVVAVVALSAGADLSAAQISDTLAASLARFKRPREIIFVQDLPRNAMGKVQKAALRESYRDLFSEARPA